jgi:glycosyltransferase involved in cell wall biosynthesis
MSDRSETRLPLSVLIPVKNEAANLHDCLASVSFVQEIVVVDSGSTGGTQAIAEAAGARVVQFVWNGKLPRKKNWALENIPWQYEWVLIIMPTNASRRNWNVRFARRSAVPTSTDFISTAGSGLWTGG